LRDGRHSRHVSPPPPHRFQFRSYGPSARNERIAIPKRWTATCG
jgi:hypothetical protein